MNCGKEKVLLVQLAKLGDFIQCTPLLQCIKEKWPRHEIIIIAAETAVIEAASICQAVDRVIAAEQFNAVDFPYEFEAVFVLNSHYKAAALAEAVKSKAYFGPFLKNGELCFPEKQRLVMSLMSQRILGRLNLVDLWRNTLSGSRPHLCLWPHEKNQKDVNKIGLQLGCRNHLRRWPVECFAQLVKKLLSLDGRLRFVLFGGRAEKALGARLKSFFADNSVFIDLIGQTDLPALGRELNTVNMLISADTGVMHLAAAVKCTVLALFCGPAFGPETGPYGQGHIIYQALADCAPCREDAFCRLRACKQLPKATIAARLAATQLGLPQPPGRLDLPPGHRVWNTYLDNFGQALKPVGPAVLDQTEVAALIINEALRSAIDAEYKSDKSILLDLLSSYDGKCVDKNTLAGTLDIIPQAAMKNEKFKTEIDKAIKLFTELLFSN